MDNLHANFRSLAETVTVCLETDMDRTAISCCIDNSRQLMLHAQVLITHDPQLLPLAATLLEASLKWV